MMPMYRYMDSHPEQKNQTFSFPQYPYPPHQPNPPMAFVPWPYGGNFGYPNPVPCYSCCNHGNAPGYNGFRPSYPQTPMPSPIHFAGGYPAPYHEAYPVQYVPPPHYSMELPRYDYDKKMPGNYHCCGCPNHSHQNKGVKIEEQESPDVVEKVNDSLVPGHMTNYPYPVVWIPPGNMKGEEQRKLSGPEIVEQKMHPDDHERPPVSLKSQEGDQRRGLLPFDMANIGSLMHGGNGERVQDQRSEDRKKEFPFPIFWMPSYDDTKRDGAGKKDKDMDASQDQQTEERMRQLPFPFFWLPLENKQKDVGMREEENEEIRKVDANARIVPTKHAESSDNWTGVNEDKSAGLGVLDRKGKDANQRVIPVKQMEDLPKKEDNSEDAKRRGREVPVKHVDDNLANKPSGSSVRSQSSSPKKSSQLPPVCLRVDPLPSKKKKGSGSSRSPSPPGHKKVQKETSADTSKASASFSLPEDSQQNMKPHNSSNGNEVEPFKKEKVIDVMDKGIGENNDSMHTSQIPVNSKEVSSKPTVGDAGKDGNQCEVNEDQGTVNIGETTAQNVEETKKTSGSVKSVVEGSNFERKMLSDVSAAVLIQSAYRGFMVRRWESLKKLKQIAEIREQVADIRNQIISLETSDLNKDDKQRVVIGETIMRLLLRLDTIQGLLPSLRDIRRSLARELVLLQEKLDDIMSKRYQDTTQEVSSVKTVEELNANGNNSVCMSEKQAEEAAKDGEEFPAAASDNSHVATEPCQGQVTQTADSLPGVEVEVPELSEHKELDTASENGQHELPGACDLNCKGLDSGPTMEWKDNIADGQAVVVDAEMANGATEFEQCGEAPSPVEDTPDHSVVSTASEVTISPELPQVAVNTEPAASEPENVEASEMSKDEMEQGGEVELTMSPDITSPIATDDATEKEAEMHELAALQLGTTDEDSGAVSELKKNEEVHMVKENDVSKSGEEEIVALQQEEGTAEELTKLGGLVDEEHTGDKVIDPEVEHRHQNEAAIDDPLPAVSQMVESQPLRLPVETSTRGVVHENRPSDLIDGVDACLPTVVDADTPNEDEVEKSREAYKDLQAVTIEDDTEMKENKAESEDSKEDIFTEKSEPLPADAETAKEDVLIDKSESLPADAETAKEDVLTEKSEPLPASPIATEVSSGDGSVLGDEGARKLIKENEKLRETLQKLMVAGKDQLQVISDLTGRVKDLEKKLAKKKKLRTKRCRAASSRSSCVKPSSNHLKERTGVAM
ncbi:BAG family molecular chaperone regulator 6 [Rosa rugosa]|uniref:BAG family molecular chaperone regulator 6 n=1 Tax=Rosa rugosa TaxID=74645 RepID=UPI002B40B95D|nr:BAG family molecular chaperone regulator 6 [Rosa rugosa]